MIVFVGELYDALRKAGVEEIMAREAAQAVFSAKDGSELVTKEEFRRELLVTKEEFRRELLVTTEEFRREFASSRAQFKADMADLRVELIKWNVAAMTLMTAIFATIVTLN